MLLATKNTVMKGSSERTEASKGPKNDVDTINVTLGSLLAQEQFGSRKTLSSVDQSLNKRLTFDLMRQLKRPGALCSNDAKSCYDRVVHSIASICMQHVGVPQEPIVCMFTTIQNLEHCIRTVYGDLTVTFSGQLWAVPMHGLGQGNGMGPPIWDIVSTPVIYMHHDEGYGAFFKASISGMEQ